mmetsp:Transcript_89679/g.233883  ORF Transcript_89679/g.233883 Transcript_89679/m.233883 type:complete len:216 (+) Transcript_89679:835-1482(+)
MGVTVTSVRVAVVATAAAVRVAVAEHLHEHQIHEEAQGADREHVGGVDLLQVVEAFDRLREQDGRQRPDDGDRQESPQDLGLLEAIGVFLRHALRRQLQADQGDDETTHVRQHVRGIRDDGQGIGNDPADNLDEHHKEGEVDGFFQLALLVHERLVGLPRSEQGGFQIRPTMAAARRAAVPVTAVVAAMAAMVPVACVLAVSVVASHCEQNQISR